MNPSSERPDRTKGLPSSTTIERRAAKADRYADFASQQGWPEIERLFRRLAADLRALAGGEG